MYRFQKKILLCAFLVLSFSWLNAQSVRVTGYVTDGISKIGIKNVVVTDGFSLTKTDTKGYYELITNHQATFIYLSNPSGYQIPTNENLPLFYKKLKRDIKQYNFQLQKEKEDDNHHILVVGADPQPASQEAAVKWLAFAKNYFKPVLDSFRHTPTIGILCGDIVGDDLSLYSNHKKAVAAMGLPCFQVLGNHDEDYGARTDEGSQNTFRNNFGPEYYSFNKGKIHYIVLDDVFFLGQPSDYVGYLNERQFSWLEKDLSYIPKGSTIILSMHIPLEYDSSVVDNPLGLDIPYDNAMKNVKHLYQLLSPYRVHVMSGHTHWNQGFEHNGIYHHIHGAICGAWWDGNTSFDGTPLGYGVYDIVGDSISWYYQSAGHDSKYQFHLSFEDSTRQLIANVWNWDKKWKVELWIDKEYQGEMKRFLGYSPVMSTFYNSLPSGMPWMKPVPTSHLFRAAVPKNAKKINVEVTDRFGNVFREAMVVEP